MSNTEVAFTAETLQAACKRMDNCKRGKGRNKSDARRVREVANLMEQGKATGQQIAWAKRHVRGFM